jgi:hypothetical protein
MVDKRTCEARATLAPLFRNLKSGTVTDIEMVRNLYDASSYKHSEDASP